MSKKNLKLICFYLITFYNLESHDNFARCGTSMHSYKKTSAYDVHIHDQALLQDRQCPDADPDPTFNLDADPDPDP
jgi:hypothetical protein